MCYRGRTTSTGVWGFLKTINPTKHGSQQAWKRSCVMVVRPLCQWTSPLPSNRRRPCDILQRFLLVSAEQNKNKIVSFLWFVIPIELLIVQTIVHVVAWARIKLDDSVFLAELAISRIKHIWHLSTIALASIQLEKAREIANEWYAPFSYVSCCWASNILDAAYRFSCKALAFRGVWSSWPDNLIDFLLDYAAMLFLILC